MFTGLVTACGVLLCQTRHAAGMRLVFEADDDFADLVLGESIAVNGVCLTLLLSQNTTHLTFDVSPETLVATHLGQLKVGDKVNFERALRVSDRLGGHYVTGHVDTVAVVSKLIPAGNCVEVHLAGFSRDARRYLCPKGSVTVDGVSLTINAAKGDKITLMLIPHTLFNTTLSRLQVGQTVNIEFDYLARMVVHQLGTLDDSAISTILLLLKGPSVDKVPS